jgi:hypothetical protein
VLGSIELVRNFAQTSPKFRYATQSKVCEFDVSTGSKQHIVGLEVAVSDSMRMQIFQCQCYLGHIEHGHALIKVTAYAEKGFEVASYQVLHHLTTYNIKPELQRVKLPDRQN